MSEDNSIATSDKEYENVNKTNVIPKAILALPKGDINRQPLNAEEFENAKQCLLKKNYIEEKYPNTMKSRIDPKINRQSYGLISFIPSKNAFPDADGLYGIMKFRGSFETIPDAEEYADKLIREHDSYAEIDIVRIGYEFPVMANNDIYTSSTREIDIRQKVEDIVRADKITKRNAENKEIKNIQDRRKQLIDPTHAEERDKAVEDIDMYTQLRVKKANALMAINESKKTIGTAESIIDKTNEDLLRLEQDHPEFKDEYLERYYKALDSVGASPQQNSLIDYMKL